MTLTILASVSLLALVSSARPLPKPDDDAWKGLHMSGSGEDMDVQQAVHAVVKSHTDLPDDLNDGEDVHVQFASNEEVQAYLSNTDSDAIKALIHLDLDDFHSPDEKELYELLNRLEEERTSGSSRSATPVPDDALDYISASLVASLNASESRSVGTSSSAGVTSSSDRNDDMDMNLGFFDGLFAQDSKPIIIMAISCAIALLAVSCLAVALYITEIMRKSIFRSTWDILPHLEKNFVSHKRRTGSASGFGGVKQGQCYAVCEPNEGLFILESDSEKVPMPGSLIDTNNPTIFITAAPNADTILDIAPLRSLLPRINSRASLRETVCNDGSESGDEIDEKFFDAESTDSDVDLSDLTTPISAPTERLAPLAAAATVTIAAIAHAPDIHEVNMVEPSTSLITMTSGTNPSPRPSWSIRAQETGSLVHAHDSNANKDRDERRERQGRGMFATPQLDAALAMQLRPGLGIGADAAWLVQFVMALFGWCAVLMSGRGWRS